MSLFWERDTTDCGGDLSWPSRVSVLLLEKNNYIGGGRRTRSKSFRLRSALCRGTRIWSGLLSGQFDMTSYLDCAHFFVDVRIKAAPPCHGSCIGVAGCRRAHGAVRLAGHG